MTQKPMTSEKAYYKLANLCSRKEMAESDLRKKLSEWGLSYSDANAVIAHLKQERYFDHERYARAFCHDKLHFNGWGRLKIRYMLREKGVEQEFIDAALAEIDEEQYVAIINETLVAKARTLNGKNAEQRRVSLLRFAASRGFEPALFLPIVSHLTSNYDED